MKRVYFFLKVFSIISLLILPTVLESLPLHEKHIVVIHSFYSELTANREIDKSIENYARSLSSSNIYTHTIYLDTANIFSLSPTRIARRTLRKLELFEQIDGFIVIGKPAFNVMNKAEFKKFGNIPTVFLSNSDLVTSTPHFFTNYLCITEDINVAPTLNLALDLFPNAQKIEIISNSNSPIVEQTNKLIQQNLSYFTQKSVSFIPDMNLTEYGEYINNIDSETIILLSDFVFSDEPHRVNENDLAFYLTKNPNLRVFTTHRHLINHNFIGGFVVDFQKLGLLGVKTLMDLINHKKSNSFDEVIYMSNQYYFNRTALQEFNIPISQLPSNYRFIYKSVGRKIKTIHYLITLTLLSLSTISLFLLLYKKLSQNDKYREELQVMQKLLVNISSKLNIPYWYQTSGNKNVIKSKNLIELLKSTSPNPELPLSLENFLKEKKLPGLDIQHYSDTEKIITTSDEKKINSIYKYFSHIAPENRLGFFYNLSEKNTLEENLNEANHLNRVLLKSINQAVICISENWKIQWYNQATINLIKQLNISSHNSLKDNLAISELLLTDLKLKSNFNKLKNSPSSIIHLEKEKIDLELTIISNYHKETKKPSYLLFISKKIELYQPPQEIPFCENLSEFFSSLPNYAAWNYQEESKMITFSKNFNSIIDKNIKNYSFFLPQILQDLDCSQNSQALREINSFLEKEISTFSVKLEFLTLNDERKILSVKGKRLILENNSQPSIAVGFLKDVTVRTKILKDNTALKEKIKQQRKNHNKDILTLKQEMRTEREDLKSKIRKLTSEKSYFEANLDFLVHQKKMTDIESLIRGISNEFNEPLSVLKLSNEVFINEIEIMLENLTAIIPLLNDNEIAILSSITNKITTETHQSILQNIERIEDITPSLRNMEDMEFETISNVSKLIVNIGLQANLKAIKPLISHKENEKILSFLMTIKNLVKLKYNINFDLDNLSRIAYSLRRFVETANPKAMGKCDLIKLIHKAISYFKYQLTDIELELSLPHKLEILCNPDDFISLLSIIIQNSLDAIDDDENGEIKIKISDFDSKVVLSIADNGIGIDDSTKPHLFEPFYTTKEIGKGIGLGLVIAKHITDNHNAELEIDTSKKGTVVSIYINKGN